MNFLHDSASAPLLLGAFVLLTSCLGAQTQTPAAPQKPIAADVVALLDNVARHRGFVAAQKTPLLAIEGTYRVLFEGMPEPVSKGTFRER